MRWIPAAVVPAVVAGYALVGPALAGFMIAGLGGGAQATGWVIAIVLVLLTGFVTAGLFILIVFGGPLGKAIAAKNARVVWAMLNQHACA